jgi:hypothetical protein
MTPGVIRQSAGMKVLINGHVIAETLRRGKQGIQFNLLDGPLFSSPVTLNDVNNFKNLAVRVWRQFFCNLREALEYGKRFDRVHRLQHMSQPRFPCPATAER